MLPRKPVNQVDDDNDAFSSPKPPPGKTEKGAKPLKSILKKEMPSQSPIEFESEPAEEAAPAISRATKQRLQEDDAEIKALEKSAK